MQKQGIIYSATNIITGKKYVGQTIQGLDKRKKEHLKIAKKGSKSYFHNSLRKYGKENFQWEIIATAPEEDLERLERSFIKTMGTFSPSGYNLTEGGKHGSLSDETRKNMCAAQKGKTHTQEARKKMSETHKGLQAGEKHPMFGKHLTQETCKKLSDANKGKTLSPETRKKISEAGKGEKNPMFGKTHTLEARKKISDAHKGKTLSPETCKKMSDAHKGLLAGEKSPMFGKHLTQETRKKISEAHKGLQAGDKHPMFGKTLSPETRKKISEAGKGEKNPMFGKHHTPEIRKKMSDAQKGLLAGDKHPGAKLVNEQVMEIKNLYRNGLTYKEIAEKMGVHRTTIYDICRGKTWTHIE